MCAWVLCRWNYTSKKAATGRQFQTPRVAKQATNNMACHFALFWLYIVFVSLSPVTLFEIDLKTIKDCKDENKFFQISNLQCGNCENNLGKVVSVDGLSCTCKVGYHISEYFGGPTVKCDPCGSNQATSEDKRFCLSCQNGKASINGRCEDCPANTKAIERDLYGAKKTTRLCRPCARNTALYPETNQPFCKVCPSCNLAVTQITNTKAYDISYDNGINIESEFLMKHFPMAKTYCEDKQNFTACQLLGNMCVMLDYKLANDNPCQEYSDLVDNPPGGQTKVESKGGEENANWPIYMPWLYYKKSQQDPEVELDKEDILIKFNTEQALPFVLAVYAANGTFVGLKDNIDDLQMCNDRASKLTAANKFATLYENSCDLKVSELWEQYKMFFYDLYFTSTDSSRYAVPLVLENYENNKADSIKSWKLLRRFFLVDNLSGRPEPSSDPKATASADKVIRVAEMVRLSIRLRNSEGKIYPPYIKVRYKSIKLNDDILKREPTVQVSFQVHYEMDTSSISQDVKVITQLMQRKTFSPLMHNILLL